MAASSPPLPSSLPPPPYSSSLELKEPKHYDPTARPSSSSSSSSSLETSIPASRSLSADFASSITLDRSMQGDMEVSLSNGSSVGSGHTWMTSPPVFPPISDSRREEVRNGPPLPDGLAKSYSVPFPAPSPPSFRPVSQFQGPPAPPVFSSPSPLRPTASGVVNSISPPPASSAFFSEIPFRSPTAGSGSLLRFDSAAPPKTDLSHVSGVSHELLENSSWSAASLFVLFSSHSVFKEKKVANISSLGFGALVCPGREVVPQPPKIHRKAYRCQNCGAYANLYCNIVPGTGQWKCPFCKKICEAEYRAASKEDLQSWPELVTSVVDYVDVGNFPPGFVPVADTTLSAPVVILIDDSLDEPHLHHLQSSLHTLLDSLPSATRLGLVTYGMTVSVYDLSDTGIAAADVFPGNTLPNKDLLKMLVFGSGVYLAPLHACLSVAHSIVSSLRPYRGQLAEASRERCLGTAVEVALLLIQGPSTDIRRTVVKRSGGNSRVIACAGGPNTLGFGSVAHLQSHPHYAYLEQKAVKQMEHLGKEARCQDTIVDILCAGTCPVRIPLLQPLAAASGGVLILHDDFGETFGLNLQRAVKRATGFQGILEARFSDSISITRIVGPGKEAILDSHDSFKHDKSIAIEMLSVEECQSFAFAMELQEDIEEENVYFQFAARYTDRMQANVTRVITIRLPITTSLSTYLQSVDEEVAAVLIGKKTALLAKDASESTTMRASLDERVKDIALKFGKPVPKTKLWRFPRELSKLPEMLFHLKRGPLLGSILGHEDERAVLRNLFLHASFDLSLRMLSPRLLMHREGGTFEELPAYDLAMQSDAALLLDHGTDLFIWMGLDLSSVEEQSAAALAACRTLAEELTEQRFPAPRILAFKEGSSQARYLQARLIPAHKDPPYEQEARFPQLRTLSADQRAKLGNCFFHVDDLSFSEWMRSLKIIPPEPL